MPEEPHGPEGWWTVNIGRPCAGRAVHRWHRDCGRRVPGRAARMQTCTTPARRGINQRVDAGRFSRFGSHLNGECGAPDTPASQPGFAGHIFHGAIRGAHSRDPLTIASYRPRLCLAHKKPLARPGSRKIVPARSRAAKPQRWPRARPGRKPSSLSHKQHHPFPACPPSYHANRPSQPPGDCLW